MNERRMDEGRMDDLPDEMSTSTTAIPPSAADDRARRIQRILDFVAAHRESTASLAICRLALGQGLNRVDGAALSELSRHLQQAKGEEIAGYYDIVM